MKKIKIVFLGTSAMIPTVERNLSSILFNYSPDVFLFDCGEGTQRQLRKIKYSPNKIDAIFISHLHGDHVSGIPGILWTMNANDRKKKIVFYGPLGIKKFISNLNITFNFTLNYDIEVIEIKKEGKIYENDDLQIDANYLDHGVPALGYSITEKDNIKISNKKVKDLGLENNVLLKKLKSMNVVEFNNQKINPEDIGSLQNGRKVSIIMDTKECEGYYKLAKNSDLMISESTHISKDEESAKKSFHMTAKQCAKLAREYGAKRLVLTHISQRYKDSKIILKDAKKEFNDVDVAYDLFEIDL